MAWEVDPPFDLAENVYRLRSARGLTSESLAEAAGIPLPRIHQIERGDANPRLITLARLAHALEVGIADLVTPPPDLPRAMERVRREPSTVPAPE